MSKVDEGNWRGLVSMGKPLSRLRRYGPKWGIILTRYLLFLQPHHASVVNKVLVEADLGDTCEECFIDALKQLTVEASQRVLYRGEYKYTPLMDMKVLGGYDTILNRQSPFSSYPEYFGTYRPAGAELAGLAKYLKEAVAKIAFRPLHYSFADYVSFRDAWATQGASVSGTPKIVQVKEGRVVRDLRLKTKWFALAHMTDTEVYRHCLSKEKVVVRPFVKQDEPAANRTVQCYDTYALIRNSYIAETISSYNGNGLWTTMEMGMKEKLAVRQQLLLNDGLTRVCTDQSGFDYHQKFEWVKLALSIFFDRAAEIGGPEVRRIADIELESLNRVELQYDKQTLPWRNGVLSGYKWTALVDSLLNYAESHLVAERLGLDIRLGLFQGDDAVMKVCGFVDKQALVNAYADMGLVVHPVKSWVSTSRCEYLHELYLEPGLVQGFPARIAKSILWRKPGPRDFGESRVQSTLDMLRKAARRGLAVQDLVRSFLSHYHCSHLDRFQEYFFTPGFLGGFGAEVEGAGRVHLQVTVEKKGTPQLQTKVQFPFIPSRIRDALLASRVAGAARMRSVKTRLSLVKVYLPAEVPQQLLDSALEMPSVRTDWIVRDLSSYSDAYQRKLFLEWKLVTHCPITSSDLPTRCFDRFGDRLDCVYRRFRSLVGETWDLGDIKTAAEVFHIYRDWARRVWQGMAWFIITGVAHGEELQRFKASAWREFISAALVSALRCFSPSIRIAV
jgi:hypothetical protein